MKEGDEVEFIEFVRIKKINGNFAMIETEIGSRYVPLSRLREIETEELPYTAGDGSC